MVAMRAIHDLPAVAHGIVWPNRSHSPFSLRPTIESPTSLNTPWTCALTHWGSKSANPHTRMKSCDGQSNQALAVRLKCSLIYESRFRFFPMLWTPLDSPTPSASRKARTMTCRHKTTQARLWSAIYQDWNYPRQGHRHHNKNTQLNEQNDCTFSCPGTGKPRVRAMKIVNPSHLSPLCQLRLVLN